MATSVVTCPSCGGKHDLDALLWPIPDVSDRVSPGETMPAGECPDCAELCYLPPGSGVVERGAREASP